MRMVKQLEGHVSDMQINQIVDIIVKQYQKYLRLTGSEEFVAIFAEEYAPHRRQHGVSWAISSAFPSGRLVGSSLKVERLKYEGGHTRPILSNELIEIHILNRTTDFDAKYLQKRYKYNSDNFTHKKLFAYIKFSVENKRLMSVSLCLPDERGLVVEEIALLDRRTLKLMVA